MVDMEHELADPAPAEVRPEAPVKLPHEGWELSEASGSDTGRQHIRAGDGTALRKPRRKAKQGRKKRAKAGSLKQKPDARYSDTVRVVRSGQQATLIGKGGRKLQSVDEWIQLPADHAEAEADPPSALADLTGDGKDGSERKIDAMTTEWNENLALRDLAIPVSDAPTCATKMQRRPKAQHVERE